MLGKTKMYVGLFLLVVVFFCLFCSCTVSFHTHEWQEATCTTARTCSICGNTDGHPFGHRWIDATCTAPKTCVECGEKIGDPLGHDFSATPWQTTLAPKCDSDGESTNTCSVCGAIETRSIPAVQCVPGNWQVVESYPAASVKVRYCEMCGNEMERKVVWHSSSGGTGSTSSTTGSAVTENSGNGDNFNTHNNPDQRNTSASYVLNKSTKKFHRPSCSDVPKIATKNYSTSSSSKSSLIDRGYSPCGHCTP